MPSDKNILITNDDGAEAKGLHSLIDAMQQLGKVTVVAPEEAQSGMSQAITVKHPLRIKKKNIKGYEIYTVNGTPADCVKLAMHRLLDKTPDLVVSGINHGGNASTSVLYSGTMGAALEGSLYQVPSIGFSLLSFDSDADFTGAKKYALKIAGKVLANGLPKSICLNVNVPNVEADKLNGIKICRQNHGYWREEFERRLDPAGREYFWLTGTYHNTEPDADDTDEWALKNNYVSIVPTQTDLTCHETLKQIQQWDI